MKSRFQLKGTEDKLGGKRRKQMTYNFEKESSDGEWVVSVWG